MASAYGQPYPVMASYYFGHVLLFYAIRNSVCACCLRTMPKSSTVWHPLSQVVGVRLAAALQGATCASPQSSTAAVWLVTSRPHSYLCVHRKVARQLDLNLVSGVPNHSFRQDPITLCRASGMSVKSDYKQFLDWHVGAVHDLPHNIILSTGSHDPPAHTTWIGSHTQSHTME